VPFSVEATAIPEVLIVRPRLFGDERGWFTEVLQADAFAELGLGLPTSFVQVNQSRSARGVIRGLHFQWDLPQAKLMRVVRGRAFMVAVDIRPGSPTLGQVVTVECSEDEPVLFWAPASFARGFCALADVTEIEYFCTATYNPRCESGIRWDDPALGIAWPVLEPQVSPKDAAAGTLADWLARPESALFAFAQAAGSPPPLSG
jgi:dTDP-4-dehydrorhamnose 3,5-epimerase